MYVCTQAEISANPKGLIKPEIVRHYHPCKSFGLTAMISFRNIHYFQEFVQILARYNSLSLAEKSIKSLFSFHPVDQAFFSANSLSDGSRSQSLVVPPSSQYCAGDAKSPGHSLSGSIARLIDAPHRTR